MIISSGYLIKYYLELRNIFPMFPQREAEFCGQHRTTEPLNQQTENNL